MRLLRKITYGEFSEFVQEKKVHILYILFKSSISGSTSKKNLLKGTTTTHVRNGYERKVPLRKLFLKARKKVFLKIFLMI